MDVLTRPLGPVAEAARRLRGVQRAMTRLSSMDSVARLVSAAPREACRAVGFERAMLSHIRGDRVAFASVSFEAAPIMAADFARLARAVRPRLDRCAPEQEAVVRQMPVLVRDAQTATGLFRPLTHVARTSAYVVAPIVRDGHTVGLLHADHFGSAKELDELDRELLWTFATGVGWAMDDIAGRGLRRAPGGDGDDQAPPGAGRGGRRRAARGRRPAGRPGARGRAHRRPGPDGHADRARARGPAPDVRR